MWFITALYTKLPIQVCIAFPLPTLLCTAYISLAREGMVMEFSMYKSLLMIYPLYHVCLVILYPKNFPHLSLSADVHITCFIHLNCSTHVLPLI